LSFSTVSVQSALRRHVNVAVRHRLVGRAARGDSDVEAAENSRAPHAHSRPPSRTDAALPLLDAVPVGEM